MNLKKRSFYLISAVMILFTAFSLSAQSARRNFNRPQTFDAQHYVIRVDFDRAAKTVIGETTIIVKPLNSDFRVLELDAVDLKFESVTLDSTGKDLPYKALDGRIMVTLDRPYGPHDTLAVTLKYTAKPKKGVYFVDASARYSAQIWTQGEPDEARHWFPSFDFPSDKATTEQYISADKGETVIGNGEFLGRSEKSDGRETWHFKMNAPVPVYLVSFVVGRYSKVEDKYGTIPLSYYIYPGREATARNAYGRTADMMQQFERLTGVKYPYNKYDQTVVANFQFGGMENITATTMADAEIFMADTEFGRELVMDLVSHELAHSWFGNLVTCRNWAELWLNEGFATFMEAAYRETFSGRQGYIAKVRSDAAQFMVDDTITRRRHGLFNLRAGDVSSLFDNSAVTYNKGGAVVHMLREEVGNETFWKGVKIYLDRHQFDSVESTDLQKAMEEASGRRLGWFFDQWIYGAGYPKLDVRQTYSARAKTLRLTFSQTHRADDIVPVVFRLPFEIEIKTSRGTTTSRIELTKRVQTVTIPVDAKPISATIDPAEKIILKSTKVRPMISLR